MTHTLILTDGGMGDLLCELVAVDYLIRHNPKVKFQVWLPDYLHSYAIHVLPFKTSVFPFSKAKKKFNGKLPGRTTQWFTHGHTPMRTHPVDYGFHMLADRHIYDMNEKNYLKIRPKLIDIRSFDLPDKYICIAATATEPVKAMSSEIIVGISKHVSSKGYTPVYLGRHEAKTGYKDFKIKAISPDLPSMGINLVNRTDMLQAAAIISKAACFIGMDGGLTHIAGSTDTHIIAGYTLVSPSHVAPIRRGSQSYKFTAVEPDLGVPNRYFQTENSFYDKDYRTFPGWEKVLESITLDKFLKAIDSIVL